MIDFKKIENIAAIVMIVAFFLPWVSAGGMFSFSGYELPNLAEMARGISNSFSEDGVKNQTNYAIYLVYLVPLLAISVLANDYLKSDEKISKYTSIAAGAFPIFGLIFAIMRAGEITGFAIGIWLTMLAAVVMLLAVFGIIKQPE